jgi:hypothetical protein
MKVHKFLNNSCKIQFYHTKLMRKSRLDARACSVRVIVFVCSARVFACVQSVRVIDLMLMRTLRWCVHVSARIMNLSSY